MLRSCLHVLAVKFRRECGAVLLVAAGSMGVALAGDGPPEGIARNWPPPAVADMPDGQSGRPPAWLDQEISESGLQRLTVATMLLLVAGSLATLLLRRVAAGRASRASVEASSPTVIGSLRLGPQMGLHWVQVQGHQALVGYDRGGLKTICVLPPSFDGALMDDGSEPDGSPVTDER